MMQMEQARRSEEEKMMMDRMQRQEETLRKRQEENNLFMQAQVSFHPSGLFSSTSGYSFLFGTRWTLKRVLDINNSPVLAVLWIPIPIRIVQGPWIRIRIQEGKNRKQLLNFIVRSGGCSLLMAEDWSPFMKA